MDPKIGNLFYLRPLIQADANPKYVSWVNDPNVNRFLECRFKTQTLSSVQDYISAFDFKKDFLFGLFDKKDNTHVGNFSLRLNHQHHMAEFGYFIGDKNYWGSSAAAEGIFLILDLGFMDFKMRKLWGATYHTNLSSIFNFNKFNFKVEGIMRQHLQDGSKIVDQMIFGLMVDDWKLVKTTFLKKNKWS